MAVAPRWDPACAEAKALRAQHEQEVVLTGGPESRLGQVITQRWGALCRDHDAKCPKCWAAARTCVECGVDLTATAHRFRCANNAHRWRGLFRRGAPPLAAEAAKRPGLARPTPAAPTRSVPVKAPPPRSAPKPTAAPLAAKPARPAAPPPRAPPRPAATKAAPKPPAKPAAKPTQPAPAPPKPRAPHEVLGVSPRATVSELRAAYREKAMDYHPDRVATMAPEFRALADIKMKEINDAYETLLRRAAQTA